MNEEETDTCGCGGHGCLEQYASATGVVRMTHKELAKNEWKTVLKDDTSLSAEAIFNAAKDKDQLALFIVDKFGGYLGRGLAQIACIVNPEVFVIGGGVAKAGDILLDSIQKNFCTRAFHAAVNTKSSFAKLGNDAGNYGSVQMLLGTEK